MINICPTNKESNILCGCRKRSCGPCTAVCDICDVAGHQPDTLEEIIVGRAVPRWTSADHDMGARHAPSHAPPDNREGAERVREREQEEAGSNAAD